MARSRTCITVATAAVACALLGLTGAPSARASGSAPCPSGGTPPPGSTVTAGLEVDGFCTLTGVTVNGGITVDPSFALANTVVLDGSTVNGGMVVGDGSGFISGWDLDSGNLTHITSTINGGLTLNTVGAFVAADMAVRGGFTMNGSYDWPSICGGDPDCFSPVPLCGSEIWGNVTVRDVNTNELSVGDPNEPLFPNGDCAGNTIHGSVLISDTHFLSAHGDPTEIEGNTVAGAVHLDNSSAEVNGNTIGGNLLCTDGAFLRPPLPPDLPGNVVAGTDTCG